MKTLADGTTVVARTFYYLLDWNNWNNYEFIYKNFNKKRLMDLSIEEYVMLWKHATYNDLKYLNQNEN